MNRLCPLLLSSILTTQAHALDLCKPSADDSQTRICAYSPHQRYAVNGLVGFPVNLRFGDDEHIKRTEFAFTGVDQDGKPTQSWRGPSERAGGQGVEADRFKTNLPIWPFQEGRSALLVVTQMPDGVERPYQFELTARRPGDCAKGPQIADLNGSQITNDAPGCDGDTATTAALSFVYPADVDAAAVKATAEKKQAEAAERQAKRDNAREQQAIRRLRTDAFYGPRNWAYQAKADPKWAVLAPSEVSDNGWLTEMRWPGNVQLPSVTLIDPVTGDERIAPLSQQGHTRIIGTTSEWFRLRLGKDAVMDIHNLRWSPNRNDPDTGTTSPDVTRTVKYRDGKP